MNDEEITYRGAVEKKLNEILEQVKYTNGRVRFLEKMVYLAVGGLGVLAIIVFPLLWALIGAGKI